MPCRPFTLESNRVDQAGCHLCSPTYGRTRARSFSALVTQRFGKGRTLAIPLGDLWRWGLRRSHFPPIRKSLAPGRALAGRGCAAAVKVEVVPEPQDPFRSVKLRMAVFDPRYEPLDNATVTVGVHGPRRGDHRTVGRTEQHSGRCL